MTLRTTFGLAVVFAAQLAAQSGSFTFATQTPNTAPQPIAVGGTIQFPAVAVGGSGSVTLVVTSAQAAQWTIASTTVTGSGFSANAAGTPVPAGGTSAFLVNFTPAAPGPATGTVRVVLTGPSNQTETDNFNLSATAAEGILLSYVINPNGNQTLIAGGGAIAFPQTQVNATVAATITVSNRTSSTVTLNAAVLLGSAYQLSGLALLPAQIAANTDQHFTLTFTPTSSGTAAGTLTLTINGSAQTISLSGQGAASSLSFSMVNGNAPTPLNPGGAIALGSSAVGASQNKATVIVRNTGNLNAQVSGIFASTLDFGLPDLPALPTVLPPGGSLSFTVVFAPRSVGDLTATLSIGSNTFTLTGTGLGSNFVVSLLSGNQKTPIVAGDTASLPNTAVGNKLTFTMEIDNTGNQPGTITTINVVGNEMSQAGAIALPATIQPGASLLVNAVFAPTTLGIVNGYIQVQDKNYGLRVVADPPPALPAIAFANVTSQMGPLLQPALGITLATPYPYDLNGLLTIDFAATELGDDPNIQFITGTRFVAFKIPANSTDALFTIGGSSAKAATFQTGTAAGVITLAATFALGNFDLTNGSPIKQIITIPESAPVIRSVEIASESANSVALLITGYSTPRSIKSLSFQFIPAPGAALNTTTLSADVSKAFDTWFHSSSGASFGSQFSLTVQLNVNGVLTAIGSIGVSATNAQGTSASTAIVLK